MTSEAPPRGHELPSRAALDAVADEAFDRIAGLVRKVLGVPVGLVSLVDERGQVFPGQAGLPMPWSETRCTPLTHSFCQYVVRSAQPLVVVDARLDPMLWDNQAIADLGVVGYAGVPLVDLDGSVVGSLCAIDTEPHAWSSTEIALLEDLAAACSAELQLRTAANWAREAQRRAGALLELSETLSATVTTADISAAVATLSLERLGAVFAGITVLDAAAETLSFVEPAVIDGPQHEQYRTFPLSQTTPSSTVATTRRPLLFSDLLEMSEDYPDTARALATNPVAACVFLPLQVGRRVLGTLVIMWSDARTFTPDDTALFEGLSRYTAQAVERAQLLSDRRDVAETLQTAMLPSLPTVRDVELAGRYLPAQLGNAVGGDWYDAFELSDGTLIASVGDVQGHDTEAAAVMGRIRSALGSLAVAVPGPPDGVLSALDTVLTQLPTRRYATGVLAAISRVGDGTSLSWSNAGHLPPVLVTPGRPATCLERRAELPLGLRIPARDRMTHRVDLPPGSTLLMYTDGLVERRDSSISGGLDRLLASVERHRELALFDMIDAVMLECLGDTDHDDDVVVFAVRTAH